MQSNGKLLRGLGFFSAFCMVAGPCIGSGVFLVASDISRSLPSPLLALSVWAAAGVLSLLGGLVFAELGSMFPGAGGQYVYLREAFGPLPAFLYGWCLVLVIQPGSIAAVAAAFAQSASAWIPLSPLGAKALAAAAVILLTGVNLLGVKKGAGLLDALTALKILALAALAAAAFLLPAKESFGQMAAFRPTDYGVALIAAFWAFDGWNNLTFVAGEVREPQRTIPLAMIAGILAVMALYLGANAAYYRALPVSAIAASSFPAAEAARALGGAAFAGAIIAAVMSSTLSCANALVLAGARVAYAMAEDRLLPRPFAFVHPRFRVPSWALLAQMAWSVALVFSGRYDQLFTYVVCAAFVFYGLTAAGLFALRRSQPDAPRAYRTPFYPILPAAYVIFTAAFVLNTLWERPFESLAGLGIVLLGVPVYRRMA